VAPVTDVKTLAGGATGARIERILCPVDFSEVSLKAYRYAQSIAGHYRAALVVQHTVELMQYVSALYAPSLELFEEFRQTRLANARQDLQQLTSPSSSIQPEYIVQEGAPAAAILYLAQERAVSLIVLGTHGRRGFDRMMLGSVTERILRHASCPVLTIRRAATDSGKPDKADDPVPIRRILCCIDFSAHSQRASEYALLIAASYQTDVTFLHVLDPEPDSADVGKDTAAAMADFEKTITLAGLTPTRTHLEVRLGKAYQEILKFASEAHSDLIVTGVRGRNAVDLAVFGSTTYRVIQLGNVPVLTVPI